MSEKLEEKNTIKDQEKTMLDEKNDNVETGNKQEKAKTKRRTTTRTKTAKSQLNEEKSETESQDAENKIKASSND